LPDGRPALDEIVAHGAFVHLEQMSHDHWWIGIEAGGKYFHVNFNVTDGRLSVHRAHGRVADDKATRDCIGTSSSTCCHTSAPPGSRRIWRMTARFGNAQAIAAHESPRTMKSLNAHRNESRYSTHVHDWPGWRSDACLPHGWARSIADEAPRRHHLGSKRDSGRRVFRTLDC
jgi:hypothetical protein